MGIWDVVNIKGTMVVRGMKDMAHYPKVRDKN